MTEKALFVFQALFEIINKRELKGLLLSIKFFNGYLMHLSVIKRHNTILTINGTIDHTY